MRFEQFLSWFQREVFSALPVRINTPKYKTNTTSLLTWTSSYGNVVRGKGRKGKKGERQEGDVGVSWRERARISRREKEEILAEKRIGRAGKDDNDNGNLCNFYQESVLGSPWFHQQQATWYNQQNSEKLGCEIWIRRYRGNILPYLDSDPTWTLKTCLKKP